MSFDKQTIGTNSDSCFGNGFNEFGFTTCSIFPEEGEEQALWFAAEHGNALRLDAPGQILPSAVNDGFYYALFKKNGP